MSLVVGDKNCSILEILKVIGDDEMFYKKWQDVFRSIGVPWQSIESGRRELLMGMTTLFTVCHHCLDSWRSKESYKATLDRLISALSKFDMEDLAQKLTKKFNAPPTSLKTLDLTTETKKSQNYSEMPTLPVPHTKYEITFGKITYNPTDEIGTGCSETKVYRGQFGGHRVAVKRINCTFTDEAKAREEIDTLRRCTGHENIVKYFAMEIANTEYEKFILIAVELCDSSLSDWVKHGKKFISIADHDVILQMAKGLAHLHGLPEVVIHRDLKPENVLLKLESNVVRIKITDFGISRTISEEKTSLTVRTTSGSDGWLAPEILEALEQKHFSFKMRRATDIFSLGCLFYFVLTGGKHPFGEGGVRRQMKMLEGKFDLSELEKGSTSKYKKVIEEMIQQDPKSRIVRVVVYENAICTNFV